MVESFPQWIAITGVFVLVVDVKLTTDLLTGAAMTPPPPPAPPPPQAPPPPPPAPAPPRSVGPGQEFYQAGSEENYGEVYTFIASVHQAGFQNNTDLMIAPIGSFMASLSLLSEVELSPRGKVVFFDENPLAVRYARLMMKIARFSRSPADVLTYIFGRDAEAFEREKGKIDMYNQYDFMALPVQPELREGRLESFLTQSEQQVFSQSFLKRGLSPNCGVRGWDLCLFPAFDPRWSIFKADDKPSLYCRRPPCLYSWRLRFRYYRGDAINRGALMYGLGWLKDEASLQRLQRQLDRVEVVHTSIRSATQTHSACKLAGASNVVLYAMHYITLGAMGNVDRLGLLRQLACGQRLAVLTSFGSSREGVCILVERNGHISSCSQWAVKGLATAEKVNGVNVSELVDSLYGVGLPRGVLQSRGLRVDRCNPAQETLYLAVTRV